MKKKTTKNDKWLVLIGCDAMVNTKTGYLHVFSKIHVVTQMRGYSNTPSYRVTGHTEKELLLSHDGINTVSCNKKYVKII